MNFMIDAITKNSLFRYLVVGVFGLCIDCSISGALVIYGNLSFYFARIIGFGIGSFSCWMMHAALLKNWSLLTKKTYVNFMMSQVAAAMVNVGASMAWALWKGTEDIHLVQGLILGIFLGFFTNYFSSRKNFDTDDAVKEGVLDLIHK